LQQVALKGHTIVWYTFNCNCSWSILLSADFIWMPN